jgi:hypothetical protein
VVHHPDMKKWDGKIYRPAKAGEGYRSDTADATLRRAHDARRREKYPQMRAEEERDGFVRNPKWQEPRFVTFSFRLAAATEIGLGWARSDEVLPVQVPLASSAL